MYEVKATLLSIPIAAVIGLALVGTTPIASASATPTSSSCNSNPYTQSPMALTACGDQVSLLDSVTTLPDGGSSYNYQIPGGNDVTLSFLTPPKDFDPGTASTSELSLYGFSPRPSGMDVTALTSWTADADKRSYVTPPSFVASDPASSDSANDDPIWSGYMNDQVGVSYTEAQSVFNETTIGSSRCTYTAESTWAGLGGKFGDGNLAQAGTQLFTPSNWTGSGEAGENQAWIELAGNTQEGYFSEPPIPAPVYATEGQQFLADVYYLGTNLTIGGTYYSGDVFQFLLENVYTGKATVGYENTGSVGWYNGQSAEFIAERPKYNGISGADQNLTNFQRCGFDQAFTDGKAVGALPWWQWNMQNVSTGDIQQDTCN
jgi:hypothetical protein